MSMLNPKLPNLELLEYKFKSALDKNEDFIARMKEKKEKEGHVFLDIVADMFLQTWTNTCCGIDKMPNGEPAWGGQAFTAQYTTVFQERSSGIYGVFFGDRIVFLITEVNEKFLEDVKNRNIAPISEAEKLY